MKKNKKQRGSITVFLTLVLSSILCFALTITELGRCYLVTVWSNRAAILSLDSLLAEYYGPLFSEYHLMAFDTSCQTEHLQMEQMEEKLNSYMINSFDLSLVKSAGYVKNRGDLMNISSIQNQILYRGYLYDNDGELMINQATEYMTYKGASNLLETLLSKMSLMEPQEKTMKVLEEKTNLDNELSKLDKIALELIELLDGPEVGKTGLKISKDGKITVKTSFVKKLVSNEPTMETTLVDHSSIFEAIRPNYFNYTDYFSEQGELFEAYFVKEEERNALQEEKSGLEATEALLEQIIEEHMAEYQFYNKKLEEVKQKVYYNQQQGDEGVSEETAFLLTKLQKAETVYTEALEEIQSIRDSIKSLTDKISEIEKEQKTILDTLKGNNIQMIRIVKGVKDVLWNAEERINTIRKELKKVSAQVDQYAIFLMNSKEDLEENFYETLEKDCEELKTNVSNIENQDFKYQRMLNTLLANQEVINTVLNKIESLKFTSDRVLNDSLLLREAGEKLKAYSFHGLVNDYKDVNLVADEEKHLQFSGIIELLSDGLTRLVIDESDISDKQMDINTVFSKTDYLLSEDIEDGFAFENELFSSDESVKLTGCFAKASDLNSKGFLYETVESLYKDLMFATYLEEHFTDYLGDKESGSSDIKGLCYEYEYLLCGKGTDQKNLSSVINKLVLIRFLANLVPAISSPTLRQEALVLATSFFSFTGLPFLIKVVQYLIIIACAYLEAVIDVATLLLGKELPIIKKSSEFIVKASDLFCINREFIRGKAENAKSIPGLLNITYTDYLTFLLLLQSNKKLCGRALDLIENNIRLQYDDTFKVKYMLVNVFIKSEVRFKRKLALFKGLYPNGLSGGDEYTYTSYNQYGYD